MKIQQLSIFVENREDAWPRLRKSWRRLKSISVRFPWRIPAILESFG